LLAFKDGDHEANGRTFQKKRNLSWEIFEPLQIRDEVADATLAARKLELLEFRDDVLIRGRAEVR
jgi:hypothetical protein